MDGYHTELLIVLMVTFTLVNGYFSLIETALTESRKTVLEKLADDDNVDAKEAVSILSDPDDYLSVSQIGITFMGILSGVTAAFLCAPIFENLLSFLPYAGAISLGLGIAVASVALLLFGEFLPKAAAFQHPENTLMKYHRSLKYITFVLSPLVKFFRHSADIVLVIFGMNPQVDDSVTEDEVKDLIEQGTEDGTFEKTEQDMVDRIFRLGDQTAYSLMTPRTQMLWLDLEDSPRHNLRLIRENNQNVFPVGRGSLDDFCGILYAKELLNASLSHQNLNLETFVHTPMKVPRSMETFRLLKKFRDGGAHEAMVLDEYGGIIGYVTLSDIMSEIIGGAFSESEPDAGEITPIDARSWYINGLCSIDDFKEHFNIDKLPEEDRDHFQTVGGFLTSYFGCIPQKGDVADWGNFRFEIVEMDRARIGKILMTEKQSKE